MIFLLKANLKILRCIAIIIVSIIVMLTCPSCLKDAIKEDNSIDIKNESIIDSSNIAGDEISDDIQNPNSENNKQPETNDSEVEGIISPQTSNNSEFQSARNFSNGYVWAKYGNDSVWSCIDVNGNILFKLDAQHNPVVDFKGEFSIVDNIGRDNQEPTAFSGHNTLIINIEGKVVFNLEESGYDKILYYDALDLGYVILSREEESFERAGTFYYVLNVNNGKIEELNGGKFPLDSFDNKDKYTADSFYRLGKYIGNGYYLAYRTRFQFQDKYFNFETGVTLYSIKENHLVKGPDVSWIVDCGGMNFKESDYYVSGNNMIVFLWSGGWWNTAVAKVNLNDLSIDLISTEWDHDKTWQVDDRYVYYSVRKINDAFVYDIQNRQNVTFIPQVDYKINIVGSKNGRLLISMRNATNTTYFTLLDLTGSPLFEPKKYYQNTFLCDEYLIYQTEEKEFSIMNLSNAEVIKTFSDVELRYFDKDNNFIWFRNSDGFISCYSEDGKIIIDNIKTQSFGSFYNDFVVIQNAQSKNFYYQNKNSEILKVKK